MTRLILFASLLILVGSVGSRVHAQGCERPPASALSIHQLEHQKFHAMFDTISDVTPNFPSVAPTRSASSSPPRAASTRMASFGFHPYWTSNSMISSYRWDLLTTIAYFGADVDPIKGALGSLYQWPTTPLVDSSKVHHVKILLTAILFSQHDSLLFHQDRIVSLARSIVKTVASRQGDGVNLDFEAMPGRDRAGFTELVHQLRIAGGKNFLITIDLPSVDWSNAFDLKSLEPNTDQFFVMAYDYHWASAPTSGAVAPLDDPDLSVRKSITTYLTAGLPKNKCILGLPWYGYDWATKDSLAGSATIGTASSFTAYYAATQVKLHPPFLDAKSEAVWFHYLQQDTLHQSWYDNDITLAQKYAFASQTGLGGIGYWALSYGADLPAFWNAVATVVASSAGVNSSSGSDAFATWPNPAHDHLTASSASKTSWQLYDLLGRCYQIAEGISVEFDIRSLPVGTYLLVGRSKELGTTVRHILKR